MKIFFVSSVCAVGCLWLAGCASMPLVGAGYYQPTNFFVASAPRPTPVRRVAVLPVTTDDPSLDAESGRNSLEPVLYTELARRGAFELVFVSPEQLRSITGHRSAIAESVLPADLFERIHAATGCEAVLFARLTRYHPYAPIVVGWSMKLVDSEQKQILWAVDEVFDAGQPAVSQSAKRYYTANINTAPPLGDPDSILLTPRRFGQYAASAVLDTMPHN